MPTPTDPYEHPSTFNSWWYEPGEGNVMDAAELVGSGLDVQPDGTVILDVSATAHMPDTASPAYRA